MTKRDHKRKPTIESSPGPGAEASAELTAEQDTVAAPPPSELDLLRQQFDDLEDRYLRLAAEYDNYRKRITRERAEMRSRIQVELARVMLEAVDDLTRVTEVDAASARARDVIAGVELVERKLMKQLETIGLERIGVEGEVFDPNNHEAVGTEPAPDGAREGTIAGILSPGYRLGAMLVRPAQVRVYVAPPEPAEAER